MSSNCVDTSTPSNSPTKDEKENLLGLGEIFETLGHYAATLESNPNFCNMSSVPANTKTSSNFANPHTPLVDNRIGFQFIVMPERQATHPPNMKRKTF